MGYIYSRQTLGDFNAIATNAASNDGRKIIQVSYMVNRSHICGGLPSLPKDGSHYRDCFTFQGHIQRGSVAESGSHYRIWGNAVTLLCPKPVRKLPGFQKEPWSILTTMVPKDLMKRILGAGLTVGILITALGFTNVFDIANPPEVLTLLAPYGQDLLVAGIIVSAISGAGLLVIKQLS